MDWFDAPEADHIYLIVYKKVRPMLMGGVKLRSGFFQPIMLHDIRNLRMNEKDSRSFQFDYRGQQISCLTNSDNER